MPRTLLDALDSALANDDLEKNQNKLFASLEEALENLPPGDAQSLALAFLDQIPDDILTNDLDSLVSDLLVAYWREDISSWFDALEVLRTGESYHSLHAVYLAAYSDRDSIEGLEYEFLDLTMRTSNPVLLQEVAGNLHNLNREVFFEAIDFALGNTSEFYGAEPDTDPVCTAVLTGLESLVLKNKANGTIDEVRADVEQALDQVSRRLTSIPQAQWLCSLMDSLGNEADVRVFLEMHSQGRSPLASWCGSEFRRRGWN